MSDKKTHKHHHDEGHGSGDPGIAFRTGVSDPSQKMGRKEYEPRRADSMVEPRCSPGMGEEDRQPRS